MNKKASRILAFVLVCLIAVGGCVIAYAAIAPRMTELANRRGSSSNPDDKLAGEGYIKVTDDNGLIKIEQTVDAGNSDLWLGRIRCIDHDGDGTNDYMYVYGYYYTGNGSVTENQLTSCWKPQTEQMNMGWGCAAIHKDRASYPDPAGAVDGQKVTRMDNCYNGCTRLTTDAEHQWQLPRVPATVVRADNIFANCTGLQRACVTTAKVLTTGAFSNCTNLKQIFLGQNVQIMTGDALAGIPTDCRLYLDGDASHAPSGLNTSGISYVKYNADVLIWATTNNY